MKNSWSIIRDYMTSKSRPGSVGHMADLLRAADLFMALQPTLKDHAVAQEAFNADGELRMALLSRGNLIAIGAV